MRNLPSLKVDKAAGTTLTGNELLPPFDRFKYLRGSYSRAEEE